MKMSKQMINVLLLFFLVLYPASIRSETVSADNYETVPLEQGVFLVAKPHLNDPNFIHSVILLVSCEKAGAMGIVVNKPAFIQLRHLVPALKGMKGAAIPVYRGGPVNIGEIRMLFTSDTLKEGALKVFDDVYFTGKKEMILSLLQDKPLNTEVRVYDGYTGWASGQLEQEIIRGDWITIKADIKKIFAEEPAGIWPSIFKIREDMTI